MTTQELPRDDNGRLITYAWPGGYPLYYLTEDSAVLCPDCARMSEDEKLGQYDDGTVDAMWNIVAADVNWEDDSLYCDHCGNRVQSAYAEEH